MKILCRNDIFSLKSKPAVDVNGMWIYERGVDMRIGIPRLPARCASAVGTSFMCKS